MKILFVGDNWSGSNARSLREALSRELNSELDDLGVDLIVPRNLSRMLRAANRLVRPWQEAELAQLLLERIREIRPDFVVVYKGAHLAPATIKAIKASGPRAVLIFPDYSPHAYGKKLQEAVGEYDLVCSTKPFHPSLWERTYGYDNKCVFVPHGYNPTLHLRETPAGKSEFDVILIATERLEYYELMQGLARIIRGRNLKVAIGGFGWTKRKLGLPQDWLITGEKAGIAYVEWLRKGKIVIAPLHTRVCINGTWQPGDLDSSRTYNIPAANCFLIHRRTSFVKTIFDEDTEVPMFDGAEELGEKIMFFLQNEELRRSMAMAAHARAVPAHSLDQRAAQIVEQLKLL